MDNNIIRVYFQTGEVMKYDVSNLYEKYPQMRALNDRKLFCSGHLAGAYGIIWNEELDLEVETIFEEGELERMESVSANILVAYAIAYARDKAGVTQVELARRTGIDQSDISKIERGVANPSVATLERIATALGGELKISIA